MYENNLIHGDNMPRKPKEYKKSNRGIDPKAPGHYTERTPEILAGRDPVTNKFLPGNQIWQLRKYVCGGDAKYSAEELLEKAAEYLQQLKDNPLVTVETKLGRDGEPVDYEIKHIRAPSLWGFYVHTFINSSMWVNYYKTCEATKKAADFIEDCFRSIKYEGGVANVFNPMLIARDLGLTEKSEVTGKDGAPLTSTVTFEVVDPVRKIKSGQNDE